MNIDVLIKNIDSIENLEKNTMELYSYLKNNDITLVEAEEITIKSFSNDYFISLLKDVFFEEKNQEILRLFIQFSLLGFTKLIYNNKNFSFQEDFIKKIKSIFYFWEEQIEYKYLISKILYSIIDILLTPKYKRNFSIKLINIDYESFFKTIQLKSNILWSIFFVTLNYDFSLKTQLQLIINFVNNNEKSNIMISFSKIYWVINKSNGLINWQRKLWIENFWNNNINNFINIITSINDKNSYKILNYLTSWFPNWYIDGDYNPWKILFNKINKLIEEKYIIENIIKNDLENFNQNNIWYIDKLCFITLKMISIFEVIKSSKNEDWKIKVIIREFYQWLDELYNIINKYDIIDDWNYIKNFLVEENNEIEWKSSFLTCIKYKNPNFKKDNYNKIAQTIISMINTNWWNILIWYIEDLKDISKDIIYFTKDKYNFFDINCELKKFRTSIDEIIRELQEIIKKELNCNIVDFDNLFSITEKNLKINWESISIYLINISKSENEFYSLHENNDKYITIRKRVKWKNECIVPTTK